MGLIVDNFAGGGGASVALERALGRPVDIAVNHDAEAIAMHTANHPETRHYQEDVFQIDPSKVCRGQPIDVAWFSPDCRHFSRAKGGAPVSKKVRGLAWVVLRWAALPHWQRPRLIVLENVTEFETWGPLKRDGQPDKAKQGETFRLWASHLEALGYVVEWREMIASDYGAPTIRKRLFLVARCDGEPIHWPKPTHGDPKAKGFQKSGLKPWRCASDIIDWTIPCPSIFTRKRPLAEKTLARIARGIQRFVIDSPQPFIVPVTHTKAGNICFPSDQPLRTITTAKGGEFALIDPTLVAAFMAQHNTGVTGRTADVPLSTITSRGTQQNVVTSHLLKLRGTCKDGQPVTKPMPTITAGGMHVGEVRAFLMKYYGSGTGQSVNEPLHTVTSKERFGLVTVRGELYQIADIGMRMLHEHELYAAQGFPADYNMRPQINGKPMTKVSSIARCGNSVSPDPAAALVRVNAPMFSILNDREEEAA